MEFVNGEDPVHAEQMQDIIGTPPRWLFRWGISVVLGIALICAFISSLINYPEIVQAPLKLVPVNSPFIVAFKDSGWLAKICIKNDCEIKKGDNLAIIENATGKTIIKAPMGGRLTYAGIVRENARVTPNQNVFYISGEDNDFYGEMIIPKNDIYKVKAGQIVMVKFRNSDENRGPLSGTIKYITNNQLESEQYVAEVDFETLKKNNETNNLLLTNGIMTDAEIIVVKTTLFHRLYQSLTRRIK